MEYPNLFPGVDVTNLEDGDEVMAYGNYCLWVISEIVPID
jgi:(S)-2-hydroxy-acid oxidase